MTGGRTGPSTRPRSWAWRVGTPTVAVLCGTLLAVSAANSDGTDLRPGRYTDLAGLVQGEAADYQRVEDEFTDLAAEVDQLAAGVSDSRVDGVRADVAALRDPAGATPRTGEGITITLADSPAELFEAALDRDEPSSSLRAYVVHQQDLQAVVNSLWAGGATAVTIAGQRIVSTTGIKCEGNAVQLQGVPYPQPYVIEAVGDQSELYSSVLADPLVTGYRNDAADPLISLGWDLELSDRVEAPAYEGVLDFQYAEPLS